jgi:peptidoglycan/LPS O-acetylase OafA/YrhL
MISNKRSFFLDIIRGISCLSIVIYHLSNCNPIGLGQAAMEIFFVLSGYLISKSLLKTICENEGNGFKNFAIRRFKRLAPALVVFLLVTSVLNLIFNWADYKKLIYCDVFSLLGFYNFYQVYCNSSVVGFGGLWSLSLEEQFYILCMLYFFAFKKKILSNNRKQYLFYFSSILIISSLINRFLAAFKFIDYPSLSYTSYLPHTRLLGFGVGILVLIIELEYKNKVLKKNLQNLKYLFFAPLALIFILISTVNEYSDVTLFFQWAIIPFIVGYIILHAEIIEKMIFLEIQFAENNKISKLLLKVSLQILSKIGIASYSIYLWHCLYVEIARRILHGYSWKVWLFLLFISLASGFLSWRYIENKFYKFKI